MAGSKVKSLLPDTTVATILEWAAPAFADDADSLDQVEQLMALEEELGSCFVVPDHLAAHPARSTFRDWVEHVGKKRRAA